MLTDREKEILKIIEGNPMISQQELADRCNITRSSAAVHISNMTRKGAVLGRGYVVRREPYIAVVGGQNMDIFGKPHKALVASDSNPGQVRMSPGGVGRNIAHNLALMGERVKFITAFGSDHNAALLAETCRRAGIDIDDALSVPGGISSVYMFITDEKGDMELAVSDMDIYDEITPRFLKEKLDALNRAVLCVADTNLRAEALAFLAKSLGCPLFVDAVSTAKAPKLAGLLDKIHTLKVNRLEAELLLGAAIDGGSALAAAAERFLDMGVQRIFISLGVDGLYGADKNGCCKLPCRPAQVINTTGAGDSLMAALAWGFRQGMTLESTALAAVSAAAISLESAETVNPALSPARILAMMEKQL